MEAGGYDGRFLEADLSARRVALKTLDEETRRKYIGGVGAAAKIVWDRTDAGTDPLSPDSPLVFALGPLTGTAMPSSSRYVVAGLSPLTGIWGEAHSGGDWADELRHAGFDGIIVTGRAAGPVYLWLHDGEAEIRDAGHVWGTDTYEAESALRKETDERASVACIGPAGERLVGIACIMNDGRKGRAAARCGLGVLMGARKLKAVVARGNTPLQMADEARFSEAVKRIYSLSPVVRSEDDVENQVEHLKTFLRLGGPPVKNWLEGSFEPNFQLAEGLRQTKPLHCRHCPYPDMESHLTPDGERHMVWEHWVPLGSQCLVGDAAALQNAYSMCNRYGVDTIETGAAVSFAMECFEKGLITTKDTGGIELRWGSAEAMLEMVRQIGMREGFGALLGEGVKKAADRIGGLATEYAMHVKGLALPAHDPRAAFSAALGYATGSLGACHQEASAARAVEDYSIGSGGKRASVAATFSELGFTEKMGRFQPAGKGRLVARIQDLTAAVNSLVVCRFLARRAPVSLFAELLSAATGWDVDAAELLGAGERNINLKRMIVVRRGISRKDDSLPPRLLTHKLSTGGAAGVVPPLGTMLHEYYSVRGWTEEGVPSPAKLRALGLEFCI